MNNHIAIEGLDGVGKTTIAKLLSNRLHLPFVEKPWSLYTDEKGELTHYLQLTKQVNQNDNTFFKMCFYSLGTILARQHYPKGLITDRFITSAVINNRNALESQWMALYSTQVSNPALTVVLYATADVRYERMYQRDCTDPDLKNVAQTDEQYAMIKSFLDNYQTPYLWIDTSNKDCETIVEEILIYWSTSLSHK